VGVSDVGIGDVVAKDYYVYIMTNKSGTLYTGVTNDLERRVYEHRNGVVKRFTSKYRITRLVHYDSTNDIAVAIAREKQIKSWSRAKKIALIESSNPEWKDLSDGWFGE
jgi:putative endonuclease